MFGIKIDKLLLMRFTAIILFYLCSCLCNCNKCIAQVRIIGNVHLYDGSPIENTIIIVKESTDKGERIVANTTTDEQGQYVITLSSSSKRLVMYVSNINIKPIKREIANISQTVNFAAESHEIELQEVFVKPTTIKAKGDTLTYNLLHFRDKNDRKLRETLERLPGITINDERKVLYNGREITEFQVEGGNLFGNKYSIALERIDPKDIIAVDVMQHHQPIRALQGNRITDDVALNVKLSPNAKNNLTGKVEVGSGYRSGEKDNLAYTTRLYGGIFNAKHQIFATVAANNSGEQLRDIYAVPLTTLTNNVLSSSTPRSSMLNRNDYMPNISEALSLNGLYKNSETAKWSYAVTAMSEKIEGRTDIKHIYYVGQQEKTHERNLDFGNTYRNMDFLLTYEQNKPRYYLMNKLVGAWNKELPYVSQNIQSTQLDENLNQNQYTLDNQFRLIYRWNEVNGLDTRFNLQYSSSHEQLLLKGMDTNIKPQIGARQKVRQGFYFAELRQEMLSTIRFGGWMIDPYWFGMVDKNTLTTTQHPSDLFSQDNNLILEDDVHYNRLKAGIGLTFQSNVARFRIRGYVPLVYSYIQVHSPYIRPSRHSLHIDPNLSIERPLASNLSLQLQWSRELHDNKSEDFLHAFIIRNSYEQTHAKMDEITSTDYNHFAAKLNYTNAFNLLFGNLRIEYTNMKSEMMTNKVVEENHVTLHLAPQSYGTHSLSLGGEVSKAFYWKKTNVSLKANHTRFSSSQMLNGVKLPFELYESSISLRGGITPIKGLTTEIQAFVNRSRMTGQNSDHTDIVTTRSILTGKITATLNKWSVVCQGFHTQQDHAKTFLANVKVYYKTKKTEWSLDVRNLLNAHQLNIVSVNAQEWQRNIFYLVPRSMILSLKFNL
ncbi:hypothetical protein [Prevotella histicola]|uniref:hypothetical protein n=1 Tax=Prevotella histicola TaxID=470565 RepID=UPI00242E34C2|nr:hypothetical protein [Prevotella histicola]